MKSSDIKVGTAYAYSRHERYSAPDRVKVLAVDVTETVKGSGPFARAEKKRGVKIQKQGGVIDIVRPQTIRQTWAEYKAEQKAAKKAREEYLAKEQVEREAQAALAFRLHTALVEKGAKVGLSYDYRDENYDALVAAGFTPATEMGRVYRSHVHSALNDLSTFMDKATVNADQVAFLLGWAEAPRPDDSLDDYDLTDD